MPGCLCPPSSERARSILACRILILLSQSVPFTLSFSRPFLCKQAAAALQGARENQHPSSTCPTIAAASAADRLLLGRLIVESVGRVLSPLRPAVVSALRYPSTGHRHLTPRHRAWHQNHLQGAQSASAQNLSTLEAPTSPSLLLRQLFDAWPPDRQPESRCATFLNPFHQFRHFRKPALAAKQHRLLPARTWPPRCNGPSLYTANDVQLQAAEVLLLGLH